MRAGGLFRVMLCDGENLREGFLQREEKRGGARGRPSGNYGGGLAAHRREKAAHLTGMPAHMKGKSRPHPAESTIVQLRTARNEMTLLDILFTLFLTHVGYLITVRNNQRRFAPTHAHIAGICTGVADELIVGHIHLPRSLDDSSPVTGAGPTRIGLATTVIFTACTPESKFAVHCWRMAPTIEKISAVTFRVVNMKASVQFYRKVLGMELLYGGERASFSSLRANDSESAILNLEQGESVSRWGRLIFHVADVDAFWTHLKEEGFDPESPRDASWGERYFHVLDPDGHELSFARPLQ